MTDRIDGLTQGVDLPAVVDLVDANATAARANATPSPSCSNRPSPGTEASKRARKLVFATPEQNKQWLHVSYCRTRIYHIFMEDVSMLLMARWRAAGAEAAWKSPMRTDRDADIAKRVAQRRAESVEDLVEWVNQREVVYKKAESEYFEFAPAALNYEEAIALALEEKAHARRVLDAHTDEIRRM